MQNQIKLQQEVGDDFRVYGLCASKIVKKVITDDICSNLKGYFEANNHSKQRKNANFLLKVPRIKPETAKSSFYYMGVKFYNDLP